MSFFIRKFLFVFSVFRDIVRVEEIVGIVLVFFVGRLYRFLLVVLSG